MDIEAWLKDLGLKQYAEAFKEHEIDAETLSELTTEDLQELGVHKLGHRKKLLKAIGMLALEAVPSARLASATTSQEPPSSYTPKHLAGKILNSRGVIEGERKQITVLFADIKGSLELIESSDPEDAQAIFDQAIRTMMEAVHRYEGTVNKVLGDGIMALFGAPLAHEDHAVRACYAALAMQQAIRHTTEEARREHGVEVQIRVGINSGEVVVRSIGNDLSMDYDAIGQTTHLAGRMEQLAIPGTIRLTHDALKLAEGFVQVNALGPIPVKGLDEPVEVFELVGATATRTRFQAAVARGLTHFVGRQTEIEALGRALTRAGDGHGQIVAVIGEPGVGKSRLFYEFTHSHRTESWLVLETGSVSYGKATAYLPVIDLLKSYFQVEEHDEARRVREKVTGKLLTLDEGLKPMLPVILSLLDAPVEDATWDALDPSQRRRRTLDAVKGLLLRESEEQPVVLVIEDLHWIDTETQAFLDSLVESVPTSRILLLVNYRPEYRHGWVSKTYYTQCRIDPLPAESARELLAALLGEDAGLGPLKELLVERAGGNPFFLEESVRALIEIEALTGTPGDRQVATDVEQVEVPATVQGVLAARIDRLSMEDKRLLQTAAVIGKDVPYSLLQAIGDATEDDLRRGLADLQAAEFLYETRLFPDLEYTFNHALTHEVAYGSLLQERRRKLHRRIAEAIETVYGDRLAEQLERLAHHYTEAGLAERAAPYWQRAGRRALERSAYLEAIVQLNKGLKLLKTLPETPQRDRQELAAQLAVGPALMSTKGWAAPKVEQAYLRARELARQVGQPAELFAVLWGLWLITHTSSRLKAAKELSVEILTLAEEESDPGLLLQAHHAAWTTDYFAGDIQSCRHHAEQGVALYKPEKHHAHTYLYGGHDPGVCCRDTVNGALWLLGYADQALVMGNEAVSLARKIAHPFSLAIAHNSLARLHLYRREPRLAQEHAEATIELCTEQEIAPFYLATAIVLRGWALANTGQIDEGLRQMQQGLSCMEAAHTARSRSHYLSLLVDGYGTTGQFGQGLDVLNEAIDLVETTGERWWAAEIYRLQGQLMLSGPAHIQAEAEGYFTQALETARRQEARSLELRAATSLAHLWQVQGKRAEAREVLAPVYDWFTEGFDTPDLKDAKTLLDELS